MASQVTDMIIAEWLMGWYGMNDDDTYTLDIDGRGAVVLTVSGEEKSGWIEHEQHNREDDRENVIFDDRGFPVPNGCGRLRMLFPDAAEVQEWRYCFEYDENTIINAQAPPYDGDEDWDLNLELTRQ